VNAIFCFRTENKYGFMTPKQMIHFFHGNAIYSEFPERVHWFIPELIKYLNKVLKAVDPSACKLTLKKYLDDVMEFDISDDHHLPADEDMYLPKALQREIERILELNPENTIKISVGGTIDPATKKVEVAYTTGKIKTTMLIDSWGLAELGNQFNQLLKVKDQQYCLLEPDADAYMYVYCDKPEFELLKKNEYVHADYLNIFE